MTGTSRINVVTIYQYVDNMSIDIFNKYNYARRLAQSIKLKWTQNQVDYKKPRVTFEAPFTHLLVLSESWLSCLSGDQYVVDPDSWTTVVVSFSGSLAA
ncbi:hypothetical protein BH11PLA2_BH11PLA2_22360 [soil metagenome]